MKRILILPFLGVLLFGGLTACSKTSNEGKSSGHLVMADPGWDSVRLHNAIVGYMVETAYGYTWEEVPGSSTITYEAMKNGEIDILTETWTDNISLYVEDLENNLIEYKGMNFSDSIQGLYVPEYVIKGDAQRGIKAMAPDLVTVKDLAKYADVFADPDEVGMGRMYGAIPGWMVDQIIYNKYLNLGLDSTFNYFNPGSDAGLTAVLADAYESGEAIVGYYWEPTWLMGKYNFIRLTDELPYNADTYADGIGDFNATAVTITTRPGFSSDHPDVDKLLIAYETSSQLTSDALAYMQDSGADYSETAKWFLKNNSDLVKAWLPVDAANAVLETLQ